MSSPTSKKIAIMQAFTEGKSIESRPLGGGEWLYTDLPSWNWAMYEYRIQATNKYVEVHAPHAPRGFWHYHREGETLESLLSTAVDYGYRYVYADGTERDVPSCNGVYPVQLRKL